MGALHAYHRIDCWACEAGASRAAAGCAIAGVAPRAGVSHNVCYLKQVDFEGVQIHLHPCLRAARDFGPGSQSSEY